MRSLFLIASMLLVGCGGTPAKQATTAVTDSLAYTIIDTSYRPVNLTAAWDGRRSVDPENPPVELDFRNRTLKYAKFDLADYYKKARIVMLDYPKDSGEFICDRNYMVMLPERGAYTSPDNTQVFVTSNYMLTSDLTNGIFIYDRDGAFVDTLFLNKIDGIKYNKRDKGWQINQTDIKQQAYLTANNDSVVEYMTINAAERKLKSYWYSLRHKKLFQERAMKPGESPKIGINDTVSFSHGSLRQGLFMLTHNAKGDTLSTFRNHITARLERGRNSTNADQSFNFVVGNSSFVRQAYSDTVFRIGTDRLTPAYLLNFGERRLDMYTGYYGDKTDKLIPNKWSEADNFILFTYTQNYECPNTRADGSIKFFYALYDKAKRSLTHIDLGGAYPENAILQNTLPGVLPLAVSKFKPNSFGMARAYYHKQDLEEMIKSEEFKKIPSTQQELVRTTAAGMTTRQLAVMILE